MEKKILKTKRSRLEEWEIEVRFQSKQSKNNNKFMELLEDKIYEILYELVPESEVSSVFRLKP
jgi:hypothetical protein